MNMNPLVNILLRTLAVGVAAFITPGVVITSIFSAIVVAIIIALLNHYLKPLLIILTLPVTLITLGLFILVINAFMVWLTSAIVPGFEVTGFWSAVLFSILLTLFNWAFAVEGDNK
ncbi:MAG TPA: phage holin family protein [Patescibacteria group bacterium]|nr:phage holin family protein [Patescibacteria group bacterium]